MSTTPAPDLTIAPHVRAILAELGEDPDREGLLKTPERVDKSYRFLTRGYAQTLDEVIGDALFEEAHESMILVKDIEFYSLCEHHMLPFFGRAHVAYIPHGRIMGLSKAARIVDMFARRLQVQERLTDQIADAIMDALQPRGVGVVIEASHLCMMMRGVEKQSSRTVTQRAARASSATTSARGTSSCAWRTRPGTSERPRRARSRSSPAPPAASALRRRRALAKCRRPCRAGVAVPPDGSSTTGSSTSPATSADLAAWQATSGAHPRRRGCAVDRREQRRRLCPEAAARNHPGGLRRTAGHQPARPVCRGARAAARHACRRPGHLHPRRQRRRSHGVPGERGVRGLEVRAARPARGAGRRVPWHRRATLPRVARARPTPSVWDPVDPDHQPHLPNRASMLRPADVAEAVLFLATRPRTFMLTGCAWVLSRT